MSKRVRLNQEQTKTILNSMKAYFEILKTKQHRSPEEIDIFDGLLNVLNYVKEKEQEIKYGKHPAKDTYENPASQEEIS